MLLGARQFFERRGAPAWMNPYVTDGLIAMWDGEWNAGGGIHDANATTWVDLSGNNHNLSLHGSKAAWSDNSCDIRSTDNIFWAQDGSWFRNAWEGQAGAMVELVVNQSQSHGSVFCCGGQTDSWQAFGLKRNPINADSSYVQWQNLYPGLRGGWKYLSDDTWTVRGWANQSEFEMWNGQDSSHGEYSYQYYAQSPIILSGSGHNITGSALFLACNYKSIRAYNRKLSASEIDANHAVDVSRFGGS